MSVGEASYEIFAEFTRSTTGRLTLSWPRLVPDRGSRLAVALKLCLAFYSYCLDYHFIASLPLIN